MKRRELIKILVQNGWYLARHGSSHDIYTNGAKSQPVPRHNEINEVTAKNILKRAGIKII
ncbi:type II toxin-antitoxin system HicA family toxin [Thermanaerosceptrum fracticalcis]|uniref:type II toxin-antitoxin system HicA family toxin n=1 Tax=Thermanaerosceptrum fracticalcis TaxID=1712410 RepID=UPI00164EBFF2|nr:type II toxin-antitoxin system HicA family toxin [Thermanaerosceptrum fracticalcis]